MQESEAIAWLLSNIRQIPVEDELYGVFENALLRRGDEAVPALVEMSKDPDRIAADRAKKILARILDRK